MNRKKKCRQYSADYLKYGFGKVGYGRFWPEISIRNKFPNMWKVAKLLT